MPIARFKNMFRGKPPKVDPTKLVPGQLERLKDKLGYLSTRIGIDPATGKTVPTAGGPGTGRSFTRYNRGDDQGILPGISGKPSPHRKGKGPGGGRYENNPAPNTRHGRGR